MIPTTELPPMPAMPEWDAPKAEWRAYRRRYRRWKRAVRRARELAEETPRWVRVTGRVLAVLENPLVRAALATKIKELRQ